jgi:class 3 adenylate cyclase/pSer/pThr/pTyr-binding forkhead associated (FHA) protein
MAYLEILKGPEKGRRLELEDEALIGRSPETTLALPDSKASRRHAVIRRQGDGFVVSDLGSANGTFLNRAKIDPGQDIALNCGDEIVIGSTQIAFRETEGAGKQMNLVMTGDESGERQAVGMTIDASVNMMEMLEAEKSSTMGLENALKRMQTILKVSSSLGATTERTDVIEKIMNNIFGIFPQADRSFILLRDRKTGEMVPAAGRNRKEDGERHEFAVSKTIIKNVVEKRQSILSSDAAKDFGSQQSIMELSIRSMMCAPFIYQDELLGVISVDTTSSMQAFRSEDLTMLTGIAAPAAVALKNADLVEAVEKETETRTQLSRYVSPDIVQASLDGRIRIDLEPDKKRGTVFFCDIVGFTAMSEKLSAIEVVNKLNRYFSVTTEIVARNRGNLHKFGGDMIMAFWNVLIADEQAEINAITTSLEMQRAVWAFDLELESEGQAPIYLGIGCNTGEFAGGNIGGKKIEYTIIGDNVNLGQRIESMAGRWQVLISEDTYLPAKDKVIAVKLPLVSLKGKSQPVQIYSIRGICQGGGVCMLNIPVNIFHQQDGGKAGSGLLMYAKEEGDNFLDISSREELAEGAVYRFVFDVPELKREFAFEARVISSEFGLHETSAPYCQATLGELSAEDYVSSFLVPGVCAGSLKNWDEMKRH